MKDRLLHNWHLKLIALALSTVLWAKVASTPTSETGVSVPLQHQNIPPNTVVYGETTNRAEVRLRGPSSLLRAVSAEDVSLSIDMGKIAMGQEKVLPLTPDLVSAPFGVEVVSINPAQVRFTVEPSMGKTVRVLPTFGGSPRGGFTVEKATIKPASVDIKGPESHVRNVEAIPTTSISLADKSASFTQTVDLDITDPVIRIPKATSVTVEVRIRRTNP